MRKSSGGNRQDLDGSKKSMEIPNSFIEWQMQEG